MAFFRVLKMKSDNIMRKYRVPEKLDKIFNFENIRIFAWMFIISRIYKIYKLVI
jgi:hypothetical protein